MFLSLGIDHTRADLAVRERAHIDDEDVEAVVTRMAAVGAREPILARTCNRVEAYCWWPHEHPSTALSLGSAGWSLAMAWADMDPARADMLLRHGTLRRGGDAVRHLLRVSAGLESQVLGDIHILGQLRRAFLEAAEAGSIGPHIHRLFESALRLGKQVRRETHFQSTCSGVGSEAARYARGVRGDLARQRCLVLGSGKIATQAARKLQALGAREISIANRTLHRAQLLVESLGEGKAFDMDALSSCVAESDLVIVATGAPQPILTPAHVDPHDDLLVIDLSVPRNVDRGVARVPGTTLVDLDALHPERDAAERSKLDAVPQVEAMVEECAVQIEEWVELAAARRSLQPFQRTLLAACERELNHLDCTPPDASRAAERIVARVMASPMSVLRGAFQRGDDLDPAATAFETLFTASQSAEI
jgi:glutamyl-tRNA reductase